MRLKRQKAIIPTIPANPKENETMTMEALREKLALERDRRARQCHAEILAILERHRCELHPFPVFLQDGRVGANVAIVAIKEGD